MHQKSINLRWDSCGVAAYRFNIILISDINAPASKNNNNKMDE